MWILLSLTSGASAMPVTLCNGTEVDTSPCGAFSLEEALDQVPKPTAVWLTPGAHDTEGATIEETGLEISSIDPMNPGILTVDSSTDTVLTVAASEVSLIDVVIDPWESDGSVVARALWITGGALAVELDGVVIRNGRAPDVGGGLRVDGGSAVNGMDVWLSSNRSDAGKGGNLHVQGGGTSVRFLGCIIEGGRATAGGGVYLTNRADVWLEGCDVADNESTGNGGHVYAGMSASLKLIRSQFTNGRAPNGSGGAVFGLNVTDVSIDGCTLTDSEAGAGWLDVDIDGANNVDFLNSSVFHPGLPTEAGLLRLANLTGGGFVALSEFHEAPREALYAENVASLGLHQSFFCGNESLTGPARGGAVHISGGCDYSCGMYNNVFYGHLATDGGAAFLDIPAGFAEVKSNTFLSNSASNGGAAFHVNGAARFEGNLLVDNVSPSAAVVGSDLFSAGGNAWFGNLAAEINDFFGVTLPLADTALVLSQRPQFTDQSWLGDPCGEPAIAAWPDEAELYRLSIGAFSEDYDGDGVPLGFDCSDLDAQVGFETEEVPGDGVDQNCDGLEACFVDEDGDGYGVDTELTDDFDCDGPTFAAAGGDCDESDAAIHPGAFDVPYDGIDQDCDGRDQLDVDGDGIESPADCDDEDPKVGRCDWLVGGHGCAAGPMAPAAPIGLGWGLLIFLVAGYRRRS